MNTYRAHAVWAGIFFILATAMGALNAGLAGPIIGDPDVLSAVAMNTGMVHVAALCNVVMAAAIVAIAVALHPILKRSHPTLAMGYLSARTIEGTVLALAGLTWLSLVPLAAQFTELGQPSGTHLQTIGDALVAIGTDAFTLGVEIVFGISALILNYMLWRTRLIPVIISLWGLLGGALLLALGVVKTLGLPSDLIEIAFTAPIALNEMVLAVWLIFRGFSEVE